jgi:hypothetical protein
MLINKIINNNLDKIFQGIRYLSPLDNKIFNPIMSKKYGLSKKSFQGNFHCGETCFMVKNILDKYKIPNKVYKSNHFQYIFNDYVSDHCFIMVDDLIVDLSYRQFIIDPYSVDNKIFYNRVFLEYSPLFIGNKENLSVYLKNLNNEYINYQELLKFWRLDIDLTEKFNLDKEKYINIINKLF